MRESKFKQTEGEETGRSSEKAESKTAEKPRRMQTRHSGGIVMETNRILLG